MPVTPLTEADFEDAAHLLGCDVEAVHAVADVETQGSGYLPDGRAVILFESHTFGEKTGHKYDGSHPNLSTPKWVHNYGAPGAHQYDRLEQAMSLDANAAMFASSIGAFQVMGENFKACGYSTVADFWTAMQDSARNQLMAFVRYLQSTGIAADLVKHDWVAFATRYNGRAEKANNYDGKLAVDYAREHQKRLSAAA